MSNNPLMRQELKHYRACLQLIEKHIDLFGVELEPAPEDIRFVLAKIKQIVTNGINTGDHIAKMRQKNL